MKTLLTDEYRRLNAQMHAEREDYGAKGGRAAETVRQLMAIHRCSTVIDYGAGKQSLAKAMPDVAVVSYDPAIAEIAEPPKGPADLLVCHDVLEHIEPDCIDAVLADIRRCTGKLAFLAISCVPAKKNLPDGRNAHLLVQPPKWWIDKVREHFTILRMQHDKTHVAIYGAPL